MTERIGDAGSADDVGSSALRAIVERMERFAPGLLACGGERPAAVLVPLYEQGGEIFVVLARRSDDVPHHKGQISFPGGTCHPRDPDLLATALREAEEEVGLSPADVRVVGRLDALVTITDFHVTPFVGVISPRAALRAEGREIVEILHVPLAHLADPANQRTAPLPGGEGILYFYDFGPHVIWGATGHILHQLLDVVRSS